jgi:hypothetical protein
VGEIEFGESFKECCAEEGEVVERAEGGGSAGVERHERRRSGALEKRENWTDQREYIQCAVKRRGKGMRFVYEGRLLNRKAPF